MIEEWICNALVCCDLAREIVDEIECSVPVVLVNGTASHPLDDPHERAANDDQHKTQRLFGRIQEGRNDGANGHGDQSSVPVRRVSSDREYTCATSFGSTRMVASTVMRSAMN